MVVLWIPNSLTNSANFSFSLNLLKTCPWWYATFIIPFFFVLIISSYRLIIFAASSGSCTCRLLCLNFQILQLHLWSSNLIIAFLSLLLIDVLSFYYLPSLSTSINKKTTTIVPNLSINSWVSGNLLLIASKTAKAIFSCFSSILTMHACSLFFYFSALCFKKYLKLFYAHSWYMMNDTKYGHRRLIGF